VRLVVGLGNPGPAYEGTRHNLGYQAVRRLGRELGLPRFRRGRQGFVVTTSAVTLLLPTTFMNLSGRAVTAVLRGRRIGPEELIVVHDDLDLAAGRLRVRRGGSSGGHRGVTSIIEELGSDDFVRVKVGIGRPPEGVDPVEFVLRRPEPDEALALADATARAADACLAVLREGLAAAMNTFNRNAVSGEADGS
jgi:PTH1 family peptidyl-tRNA hydrolase